MNLMKQTALECDFCSLAEPEMWCFGHDKSMMILLNNNNEPVKHIDICAGEIGVCSKCLPLFESRDEDGLFRRAVVCFNLAGDNHNQRLIKAYQVAIFKTLTGTRRYVKAAELVQ